MGKTITYKDLKEGYILQIEDFLCLHGVEYIVTSRAELEGDVYFLRNASRVDGNGQVFTNLGITEDARERVAREYGAFSCLIGCSMTFPEFDNRKKLTDYVIALYEISPYKKGDYVTIVKGEGSYDDYPFGFTQGMRELDGYTYRIESMINTIAHCDRLYWQGDPHSYLLEGTGCSWHSSMFRKATHEEEAKAMGIRNLPPIKAASDLTIKDCAVKLNAIAESLMPGHLEFIDGQIYVHSGDAKISIGEVEKELAELRLPLEEDTVPHINL